MSGQLKISLLGETAVQLDGEPVPLPASRKTRALLAFLATTNRPHRRERLCELLWDLPDDPKASLRWSLSKLRKILDAPDQPRLKADRERVALDVSDISVDLHQLHFWLEDRHAPISLETLETLAMQLEDIAFEGLDGVGGDSFDSWLKSEREDLAISRISLLRFLLTNPQQDPIKTARWRRTLREIDPEAQEPGPVPSVNNALNARPEGIQGNASAPKRSTSKAEQRTAPTLERQALRTQRIGFCTTPDGTKIAHASVGLGPPILKTANWLTHLEFDWSSPIWGQSFVELSRSRTFIRYDERGCGLSDWDVKDISFDAFVEDLEVVADSLGLERFPLLGISQGAAVSIEYAARHPERVSALILVSGYTTGWRIHASPEEQERRDAVLALTKVGWGTDNPAYRHIFSSTFMPDAEQKDLAWFDEFQRLTTSAGNAARFQDAFGYIDVRDRLGDVQAPTIVFHSNQDQRIPIEQGRDLASGIRRAQFVPLDSKNHILVASEPALRDFTDLTARFLEEHGG